MLRRIALFSVLLLAAALVGCGGKKEPPATGTGAAPPANTNGTATNGTGTTPAGGETGANTGGTTANGTGGGTVSAELAKHGMGLSIVQPDSFVVAKLDAAAARNAPLAKQILESQGEFIKEQMEHNAPPAAGSLMEGLEQVWVAIGPPSPDIPMAPVSGTLYARFKDAATLNEAVKGMPALPKGKGTFNGVEYLKPDQPGDQPYILIKDAEIFFALTEPAMQKIIGNQGKPGDAALMAKLKNVNLDQHLVIAGSMGPFRDELSQQAKDMAKGAPQIAAAHASMAANLVEKIDWATIALNLQGDKMIDINIDTADAESSEQLNTLLAGLLAMAKQGLSAQAKDLPNEPGVKESFGLVSSGLNGIKVETKEKTVNASLPYIKDLEKLPAIIAAARGAAQKVSHINNARMLVIGALNHEAAMRKMPADIVGADGTPLLSWRCAILPFVEESRLFDMLKRDQSWDGPDNATVAEEKISLFNSPGTDNNLTSWKLVAGSPGGIFIIDAGPEKATPWAQPEVFKLDPADPAASLGTPSSPQGYIVAFTDGHVETLDIEGLKAKLAGGEGATETPVDPTEPPETTTDPEPEPTPDPTDVGETPAPEARTWKDASGKFSVEAVLGEVKGATVTIIRTDNGKPIMIPISKLSKEDQDYLKSLKP